MTASALLLLATACSSTKQPAVDAGLDTFAGSDGASDGGDTAELPNDPIFTTFWSGTALATPAQAVMVAGSAFVSTFRTYAKPRTAGAYNWRFWISNATDSTYGAGPLTPNQPGGAWRIEAATVGDGGPTPSGSVVSGTLVPVTFSGSATRDVQPGERFWSDPVNLDLPAGDYLVFTWAISAAVAGPAVTYTHSSITTSYEAPTSNLANQESATGFEASTDTLVAPHAFAYDRPVTERLCFLGDSITQGIGSTRDSYGFWVSKIADGLGPDVGVWNLGSGYARAADAASDGSWLYQAKQCTEVAVILGVNDINADGAGPDALLGSLTTILARLKQTNPAVKLILFTVPTFNFTGTAYTTWKQVNTTILATPPAGADRVFDIAAVLSQPAPNDGLIKAAYMNGGDAHPNNVGSADIATAFLAWY